MQSEWHAVSAAGAVGTREADDVMGRGLAARLLRGAGRATLAAYAEPGMDGLDVVAHGWHAELGGLLVACAVPSGMRVDHPVDVRLRIDKMAPLALAEVLTGSLIGLGQLVPLGRPQVDAVADSDLGALSDAVHRDGVLLAVIVLGQTFLHAHGVIARVDVDEVLAVDAWPPPNHELVALEAVCALGEGELREWAGMVATGDWPGRGIGVNTPHGPCAHLAGRVLVVDIDAHGLSLLLLDPGRVRMVNVLFARPVASSRALHHELQCLGVHNPTLPNLWDATDLGA